VVTSDNDIIKALPWDLILPVAKSLDLNPHLIASFIMVESGGNPWRTRYEKGWKYFYFAEDFAKDLGISLETELNMQAMSWGYLQIMGAVARECSFDDHLTKLVDPKINITVGCAKIADLAEIFDNDDDIAAAYNGGNGAPHNKLADGRYKNASVQNHVMKIQKARKSLDAYRF